MTEVKLGPFFGSSLGTTTVMNNTPCTLFLRTVRSPKGTSVALPMGEEVWFRYINGFYFTVDNYTSNDITAQYKHSDNICITHIVLQWRS